MPRLLWHQLTTSKFYKRWCKENIMLHKTLWSSCKNKAWWHHSKMVWWTMNRWLWIRCSKRTRSRKVNKKSLLLQRICIIPSRQDTTTSITPEPIKGSFVSLIINIYQPFFFPFGINSVTAITISFYSFHLLKFNLPLCIYF